MFVQGAGEEAYAEDESPARSLQKALGGEYRLSYPKFSGLENIAYDTWKDGIAAELDASGSPDIVPAHSLGGAAMLKYLSQEREWALHGQRYVRPRCAFHNRAFGIDETRRTLGAAGDDAHDSGRHGLRHAAEERPGQG